MKIVQTDLSNIVLGDNDDVSIVNINNAIVNLLSNDLMLFSQNMYVPQVWERKWFNDSNAKGYDRGYCVWYNVDEIYEFASKNSGKIIRYIAENTQLKEAYNDLSSTQAKQQFLVNVVSGYTDTKKGLKFPSLFELGQLSCPAAIYISKKDNNKDIPIVNGNVASSWREFVINDDNNKKISAFLSVYAENIFKQHIENYHLGNIYTSAYLQQFLKKDMSNISRCQQFNSHTYQTSAEGFDYVKLFVKNKTTQRRLVNCVLKESSIQKIWKNLEADVYTENGLFSTNGASKLKQKMIGCNNYLSDNIALTLDGIVGTSQTIVDIVYTANKSVNAVPQTTKNLDDIENRVSAYNVTFNIIPISTSLSSAISDYIDRYAQIEVENKTFYNSVTYSYNTWFKQWSSGYLEHGGIIAVPANAVSIDVPFDWTYVKNGRTYSAPVYDYPESQFSTYGSHTMLDLQRNLRYDKENNLKGNRYVVDLTPINNNYTNAISGDDSGYPMMPNQNEVYCTNEVVKMTNKSFSIVVEPRTETSYISYYVSGYRSNMRN